MGGLSIWGRLSLPLIVISSAVLVIFAADLGASSTGSEFRGPTGPPQAPYPTVVFGPLTQDYFYPNAERTGYQDIVHTPLTYTYVGFADLDDDGYLDQIQASYLGTSCILWGTGLDNWTGGKKTVLSTTGTLGIATGDFNGDGAIDIAFASLTHDFQVFLNMGKGAFSSLPDIELKGSRSYDINAGDLNNDGFDDIITRKGDLFLGGPDGPGGYLDREYPIGDSQRVEVIDVDEDGYLDLIFSCPDVGKTVLFLGGEDGPDDVADITFDVGGAFNTDVGDFDGDSLLDIVMTGNSPPRLILIRGTATGWDFSKRAEIPLAYELVPVRLCDIDLDGVEDILVGNATSFDVYLGGGEWPPVRDLSMRMLTEQWDLWVAMPPIIPGNASLPSAVLNLSVTQGERNLTLAWDAPADTGGVRLFGYRVYRGDSRNDLSPINVTGRDERSFTDTGLEAGRTYYYAARAVNKAGEGPRSEIVEAYCIGVPAVPRALLAEAGRVLVRLSWAHPVDIGGLPLLGYRVRRGTVPLCTTPLANLSTVAEFVDTNVSAGVSYHYELCAFNCMGDGQWAGNASAMPFDVPGIPTGFNVSASVSRVTLRWWPPADGPGREVLGYRILRGDSAGTLQPLAAVGPDARSFDDLNVTNGRPYFYAVKAFNEAGDDAPSTVLGALPRGPPGKVRNLAGQPGDSRATLTWEPPEEDGGFPILGYRVMRGQRLDDMCLCAQTEETTYTRTMLTNGAGDYYQVCAFNAMGFGPLSESVLVTPASPPDAPLDLFLEPSVGSVNLSWLAPPYDGGSAVTGYTILRGLSIAGLGALAEVGVAPLRFVDASVSAGTTYYYAVAAANAAGLGPASRVASAIPFEVPGAPINLTLLVGDGWVTLAWNPPPYDGGSAISGYVILRGTSPGHLPVLEPLVRALDFIDRTATNGVTYYYAVAAANRAGTGKACAAVNATPLRPATFPGVPRGLTARVVGGSVSLCWTAPASDGGSPVVGYRVLRGETRLSMVFLADVDARTSFTDVGVQRGRTYHYSVRALNAAGLMGNESEAIGVRVPAAKDGSPALGPVAASACLVASAIVLSVARRRRRRPRPSSV